MGCPMLQVTKRAASEAEARAILDASYQVESPFGVPILLVDPSNYARKSFMGIPLPRLSLKNRVHQELAQILAKCDAPAANDSGKIKVIEDRGYFDYSPQQLENKIIWAIKDSELDKSEPIAFAMPNTLPRVSVTIHREATDIANQTMRIVLGANRGKTIDYPGYDAQYNFISLWHEHAHSVSGTNEAGAEKIAGLMARYAFEDCTFLAVQADMRAVHSILRYKDEHMQNTYGWPCVEVLDDALAMETPPTWDEIRKAGETSYDTPHRGRFEIIKKIGHIFNMKSGVPFLFRDLKGMADVADECLQEESLTTGENRNIAQRFALAARRLSIGRAAYQQMTTPSPYIK